MAASNVSSSPQVAEPFPIFKVAHRFLLYDANTIAYIRERYNIGGVLIGGLPQAPQQNVFLGIPLELMPEEARILVEKGVAFVRDDVKEHKEAFLASTDAVNNDDATGLSVEERRAYQAALRNQGMAAAAQASKKTDERRQAALSKLNAASGDWNDIPDDMLRPSSTSASRSTSRGPKRKGRAEPKPSAAAAHGGDPTSNEDSLFGSSSQPVSELPGVGSRTSSEPTAYAVTPTTSYPPLKASSSLAPPPPPQSRSRTSSPRPQEAHEVNASFPVASPSYPLFRHLHHKGYFLAPGLRFGCQYMAYPGDPLRFHSHFLCNGVDWDEEFDLLSVVGGGRLGTGVKKGYLLGGAPRDDSPGAPSDEDDDEHHDVRAFCIEWAGM